MIYRVKWAIWKKVFFKFFYSNIKWATLALYITYEYWVALFKAHPILASKALSTEANTAKKKARMDIINTIQNEKNLSVSDLKVRKAFNNQKAAC